ncbi:MAG TPA: hypothetical protein VM782_14040, partial [Stellaceae bacterium]|nr:hypothetical protein [Stellaceae bacterium]
MEKAALWWLRGVLAPGTGLGRRSWKTAEGIAIEAGGAILTMILVVVAAILAAADGITAGVAAGITA